MLPVPVSPNARAAPGRGGHDGLGRRHSQPHEELQLQVIRVAEEVAHRAGVGAQEREHHEPNGAPPGRAPAGGLSHAPAHGSMSSIPVSAKSRMFLVASTMPREREIAAIRQSACEIGRPAARRAAAIAA